MKKQILLAVCAFYALNAADVILLDPIAVQSTSMLDEQKEDSIAKRVISAKELTQYGDMNALEILQRTPGVSINTSKRSKGAPGKGYTKILVDGEEVSVGNKRMRSPLENISPEMIEKIEVMTNGSAEQSAEAMGGIVNIVLKKPKEDGKTIAKIGGSTYDGRFGGDLFSQYEAKQGRLSYMVNATYNDTTTHDIFDEMSQTTSTQDSHEDEIARIHKLNLTTKMQYTQDSSNKYMFDGMVASSTQNTQTNRTTLQSLALTNDTRQNSDGKSTMYWLKSSGEHHIGQNTLINWRGILHANTQKEDSTSFDTISSTQQLQNDKSTSSVYGGNLDLSHYVREHFFKTGLEYKHLSQVDDTTRFLNGANVSTPADYTSMNDNRYAIYGQDEYTINEKMVLTPGIRYEETVREYTQHQSYRYFAPSLHFLYHASENDNIRASVAKTVKLPRLDEISTSVNSSLSQNSFDKPDTVGNPNLHEESAISYEVRLEHYFNDKGIASLNSFYRNIYNKIEKQINLESGRYVERPYNSGDAILWGLEFEWKKSLDSYVNGLGIWGNTSYQRSRLENGSFQGVIAKMPDYMFNAGFDHKISSFTYGASYRYNGGFSDPIDQTNTSYAQPGYGTLDLYLTKRFNEHLKLTMNAKNLTAQTIKTTAKRYSSGVLQETQIDNEATQKQFLITLEGRW